MKHKNQTWISSLFVAGCCVLSFVGCATEKEGEHAKTEQQNTAPEQLLKVGMTKAEVEKILGKPSGMATSSDGSEVWAYNDTGKAFIPFYAIGGGKFKHIAVTFDQEGKVKNWTTANNSMY